MTLNLDQMTLNFDGWILKLDDLELSEKVALVEMTLNLERLVPTFSYQPEVTLSYDLCQRKMTFAGHVTFLLVAMDAVLTMVSDK